MNNQLISQIHSSVDNYINWLNIFGENSQDYQDFYASPIGRKAKGLYYKKPILGIIILIA